MRSHPVATPETSPSWAGSATARRRQSTRPRGASNASKRSATTSACSNSASGAIWTTSSPTPELHEQQVECSRRAKAAHDLPEGRINDWLEHYGPQAARLVATHRELTERQQLSEIAVARQEAVKRTLDWADRQLPAPEITADLGGDLDTGMDMGLVMAVQRSLEDLAGPHGLTRAELMTAREVAELLAVPVSTVREWGRNGTLPRVKLGGHVRYIRSHVEVAILNAEEGSSEAKDERRRSASRLSPQIGPPGWSAQGFASTDAAASK